MRALRPWSGRTCGRRRRDQTAAGPGSRAPAGGWPRASQPTSWPCLLLLPQNQPLLFVMVVFVMIWPRRFLWRGSPARCLVLSHRRHSRARPPGRPPHSAVQPILNEPGQKRRMQSSTSAGWSSSPSPVAGWQDSGRSSARAAPSGMRTWCVVVYRLAPSQLTSSRECKIVCSDQSGWPGVGAACRRDIAAGQNRPPWFVRVARPKIYFPI